MRNGRAGSMTVALVILLGTLAARGEARMTVMYDVVESVQAMTATQPDGSPGLVEADGLFQQQPAPLVLGAARQVEKVSGGTGTTITPSIRGLSGPAMAALFRARVDAAGANMMFVDIGPTTDDFPGTDGANLDAALGALRSVPFAGGGSYADRVHLYVGPERAIADPVTWAPFWHAMSLAGGVWFEAYHGTVQWSPEHWLAWPRALRDGLVALGADPTRLHTIVRGAGQAAVWSNMRVGAACDLLANGPGAYRIDDRAGFVREFRVTFGTVAAPVGPSPLTCSPLPVLPEPRATQLAEVLELERIGARVPRPTFSSPLLPVGKPTTLIIALGADPLGIAARLGAPPSTFWATAQAKLTITGPGINAAPPLASNGSVSLTLTPTAKGPISVGLVIDGAAVRQALGPPVDLAVSLGPHKSRIGAVLTRMIAQPLTWQITAPLISDLKAGVLPPRLTMRVLRRRVPPRRSLVEFRLSRPAKRLLVEVGIIKQKRFVLVRRLRITGTRAVVLVRIPRGTPLRARIAADALQRETLRP